MLAAGRWGEGGEGGAPGGYLETPSPPRPPKFRPQYLPPPHVVTLGRLPLWGAIWRPLPHCVPRASLSLATGACHSSILCYTLLLPVFINILIIITGRIICFLRSLLGA